MVLVFSVTYVEKDGIIGSSHTVSLSFRISREYHNEVVLYCVRPMVVGAYIKAKDFVVTTAFELRMLDNWIAAHPA